MPCGAGQTRKHCWGNIVSYQCLPGCPPRETLLRKQNILPRKQKCFPTNLETFFAETTFARMFSNVSSTSIICYSFRHVKEAPYCFFKKVKQGAAFVTFS